MTKFSILKGNDKLREQIKNFKVFADNKFFLLLTEDGIKGFLTYKENTGCAMIKDLEFDFSIEDSAKLFDALVRAAVLSLTESMRPYVVCETRDEVLQKEMLASVFSKLSCESSMQVQIAEAFGLHLEETYFVDGVKLFSAPCKGHEFA